MISINCYKPELTNIKNVSLKILNQEYFKIEDIIDINKMATSIINREDTIQKIKELKNRYNPNIKLIKVLDYVDKIEVENNQLGSLTYWRRFVKIGKFYFYQECYGNNDNDYDNNKYLYFGEIGEHNLNKFSFYYIENGCGKMNDKTIKNKIISFINEFCEYFKIDATIDPVDFLFFILIMVHHDAINQCISNIDLDYDGYLFDQMFKYDYDDVSNYLNTSRSIHFDQNENIIENINQTVKLKKYLAEPWFSLVCCGLKTSEARLNIGNWNDIEVGDIIEFNNDNFNQMRKIKVKINNIRVYYSFREYLENEEINKCLPTIKNINDGVKIYEQFYKIDDNIKSKLVKSFCFDLISNII